MRCPECGHHTWHVDRSVHEEANDHNKLCNAGAIEEVKKVLAAVGMEGSTTWHYRRRTCRRCGIQERFVEIPLRPGLWESGPL